MMRCIISKKDNVVHMGDLMFINMIPVYRVKRWFNFKVGFLFRKSQPFLTKTLYLFSDMYSDKNSKRKSRKSHRNEKFLRSQRRFYQKSLAEKTTEQLIENRSNSKI